MRLMGKEKQLYRVFGPVFLAGLVIVACQDQKTAPTGSLAVRTATIAPETKVLIDQQSWELLPAREKIKTLEARGLDPAKYEIKTFNPLQELTGAVAAFYCEQTKCLKDLKEMAANVSFLDSEKFLQELEKDEGRVLPPQEKEDKRVNLLEKATISDQVLLNWPAIENYVRNLPIRQPEIRGQVAPADLKTVAVKSLLFHAFTHANAIEKTFEFESFSVEIGPVGSINFNAMRGFRFEVEQNGRLGFINGVNEAFTELVARQIGLKTGIYLAPNERYARGANLLAEMTTRAGIGLTELIRYNNELPVEQLLRKLGRLKNPANPDQQAAVLALSAVALYVDGSFSFDGAKGFIEKFLYSR